MTKSEIIQRARAFLGDISEKSWSDGELGKMVDSAVRRYCEDSELFRSRTDFYPDIDGNYKYPSDFIKFQAGWNASSNHVSAGTATNISGVYDDYINIKGEAEYIYDEISKRGYYKLCPNPVDLQAVTVDGFLGSDYGTSADDEYGEYIDAAYGVILSVTNYTFAGDMAYISYASESEIKDYMALVYAVASMAFNTDADFSDADKGEFYKRLYRQRVGMLTHTKASSNGITNTGNYF